MGRERLRRYHRRCRMGPRDCLATCVTQPAPCLIEYRGNQATGMAHGAATLPMPEPGVAGGGSYHNRSHRLHGFASLQAGLIRGYRGKAHGMDEW